MNLSHPTLFIQAVGHLDETVWLTSSIFRTTQGAQISLALPQSRCPPSGEVLFPWEGEWWWESWGLTWADFSSQACDFSAYSCLLPWASSVGLLDVLWRKSDCQYVGLDLPPSFWCPTVHNYLKYFLYFSSSKSWVLLFFNIFSFL